MNNAAEMQRIQSEEHKRFQTNHLIRRAEVNNRITFS